MMIPLVLLPFSTSFVRRLGTKTFLNVCAFVARHSLVILASSSSNVLILLTKSHLLSFVGRDNFDGLFGLFLPIWRNDMFDGRPS